MHPNSLALVALSLLAPSVVVGEVAAPPPPPIASIHALAFGPGGVLFVGDGEAGAILAIETGDVTPLAYPPQFAVADVETRIAAAIGVRASEVMLHDLAVNPTSGAIWLAVSRGRGRWASRWDLPNDLERATILVRLDADGTARQVEVANLPWTRSVLPNPIEPGKLHQWKQGLSMRTESITEISYEDGRLWIAGLSNEEFASALWKLPYPFGPAAATTTVEIFHGAHGEWETQSPIRTFVPWRSGGKDQLLAAYLCTPLVIFDREQLVGGFHVKGRTVAEFGSGNYPLDMVLLRHDGREKLLIANSNLPLLMVDGAELAAFDGEITAKPTEYVAGVPFEFRAGVGIQQLEILDQERVVMVQRLPGGTLDLYARNFTHMF